MPAVTLVAVMIANFGLQAGCSRTAWAFARDKGLPASRFLENVSPRTQVPLRAVILSVIIQSLLGLINISSTAAFNAFITPGVLGVLKRLRGEPIPYGPFSLRKWRNPINAVAILYTFFTSFFLFWPAMMGPTATTMNCGVVFFSVFWWFVEGRKSFVGPNIEGKLNQLAVKRQE
ncbi:hypothetical protein B0A55_02729 [Friedmanniomyces simplex]|uniref:Uncharacterized protein n=1 Tax=Friedmanniomyces simplex TaxID=329884 RepID=A0A4U0XP11_9PEZI|nr:hypothetical protein B0A55_02729 [Friedmanniomyces simplex]